MTDQNNQHPFAMTKEQEQYFLEKHLGGGQTLPRPPGSRIVHRREVLPVSIRRLSEIADELKRKHGRNVMMKQEGHELVFFSENDREETPTND